MRSSFRAFYACSLCSARSMLARSVHSMCARCALLVLCLLVPCILCMLVAWGIPKIFGVSFWGILRAYGVLPSPPLLDVVPDGQLLRIIR